ncbi:restriction endonuclease fold toxin-2 domain-containing protein, partial [Streptomyces albus]
PIGPPNPPDPRFPRLSPGEQKNFRTWLQSLNEGHISGGKPAEVAYQKRIAGYPEYEVPIPKGISPRSTLMVDGFRATDGMAVEAKFVNRPDEPCYRRVEDLRKSHNDGKKDFLYEKDRVELRRYAAALGDPRNKEMRGVETVTNNRESAPYWRVMMAAYGVKGYARYVP